jgi:hypothetical protein
MNKQFLEEHSVKLAHLPKDLNGAATTGARIKLDKGERLVIKCAMGDSTAAVATFTIRQHDAASAGTSKDLEINNPYFKKVAAATSFTRVEVDAKTAVYALASDFASQEGVVVFEVLPQDLDVNNDFAWVSVDIANATASKIASTEYILYNANVPAAYGIAL